MRIASILIAALLAIPVEMAAQEIDFGQFGREHYTLILTVGAGGNADLDFGQVVRESGENEIVRAAAAAIEVEGVEYLDIFVTITVENQGLLLLDDNEACITDPSCSVPLTLFAGYYNEDDTPNPENSIEIPIVGQTAQARFPVRRQLHAAPAPPPTPPTGAFDQSQVEARAWLFFWGTIDVGDVDAGSYTGSIEVEVSYEFFEEPD